MRISGVATIHAPPGRVWAALHDPAVLVATIPGCERLERASPGSYRFTIAAGVASIQGVYTGQVSLSQQQQPSSVVLTASGAGGPGTVSTCVQIRLADIAGDTTELSYDADAVIGGLIAGVGQRMLSSVAKRMAGEFFSSVDDVLADAGAVSQVAAPAGLGPASASTVPVPAAPQAAAYLAPERGGSSGLPPSVGFARGVLVGAAVTLAGVAVRGLIGRNRRTPQLLGDAATPFPHRPANAG